MGTKLKIYFNGITAVAQPQKRLLMVDARLPSVSRISPDVAIPAHFPFVRFLRDDLLSPPPRSQYWEHDYVVPTDLGGDGTSVRTGVVILDHHKILIPRKAVDVPGPDYGTLAALADMGRLDPTKGGRIDQEQLEDPPGDVIGAFVDLPAGEPVCLINQEFKYRFTNLTTGESIGEPRKMGQLCIYGVQEGGTEDPTTIRFEQYGTRNPIDFSLLFRPETTWIMIGLSSLEDLLQLRNRPEPIDLKEPHYFRADHHFELVYKLSKDAAPRDMFLPQALRPEGDDGQGPGKELDYPRCIPPNYPVTGEGGRN